MTATVRVVGAPRSGVTSLADALRGLLAGHHVVETDTTGPPPAVVVAACSAVAPLTESDCAAIDVHARTVDVVIGVLTKVDAHRRWREVLDANRAALAAYAPRYRDVTWVCVAAAPDVGAPSLDDLVTAVCDRSTRVIRKDLQRSTSQRPARRADAGLRVELQRQRIRLGRYHRQRCAELRTAQRDRAARASRAEAAEFGTEFAQAAGQVLGDLRQRIGTGVGDLGPELPPLPPRGGGAETRLTLALGAGFGLGVAATVGRVATTFAPGLAVAAVTVAVLAGCVLTAWLVSTRALLHRRATLDRWVTEAVAAVRSQGDEMIADALLDAHSRRTGPISDGLSESFL